jgi:hypothetical protein
MCAHFRAQVVCYWRTGLYTWRMAPEVHNNTAHARAGYAAGGLSLPSRPDPSMGPTIAGLNVHLMLLSRGEYSGAFTYPPEWPYTAPGRGRRPRLGAGRLRGSSRRRPAGPGGRLALRRSRRRLRRRCPGRRRWRPAARGAPGASSRPSSASDMWKSKRWPASMTGVSVSPSGSSNTEAALAQSPAAM